MDLFEKGKQIVKNNPDFTETKEKMKQLPQ
jgi:hypothetical protein